MEISSTKVRKTSRLAARYLFLFKCIRYAFYAACIVAVVDWYHYDGGYRFLLKFTRWPGLTDPKLNTNSVQWWICHESFADQLLLIEGFYAHSHFERLEEIYEFQPEKLPYVIRYSELYEKYGEFASRPHFFTEHLPHFLGVLALAAGAFIDYDTGLPFWLFMIREPFILYTIIQVEDFGGAFAAFWYVFAGIMDFTIFADIITVCLNDMFSQDYFSNRMLWLSGLYYFIIDTAELFLSFPYRFSWVLLLNLTSQPCTFLGDTGISMIIRNVSWLGGIISHFHWAVVVLKMDVASVSYCLERTLDFFLNLALFCSYIPCQPLMYMCVQELSEPLATSASFIIVISLYIRLHAVYTYFTIINFFGPHIESFYRFVWESADASLLQTVLFVIYVPFLLLVLFLFIFYLILIFVFKVIALSLLVGWLLPLAVRALFYKFSRLVVDVFMFPVYAPYRFVEFCKLAPVRLSGLYDKFKLAFTGRLNRFLDFNDEHHDPEGEYVSYHEFIYGAIGRFCLNKIKYWRLLLVASLLVVIYGSLPLLVAIADMFAITIPNIPGKHFGIDRGLRWYFRIAEEWDVYNVTTANRFMHHIYFDDPSWIWRRPIASPWWVSNGLFHYPPDSSNQNTWGGFGNYWIGVITEVTSFKIGFFNQDTWGSVSTELFRMPIQAILYAYHMILVPFCLIFFAFGLILILSPTMRWIFVVFFRYIFFGMLGYISYVVWNHAYEAPLDLILDPWPHWFLDAFRRADAIACIDMDLDYLDAEPSNATDELSQVVGNFFGSRRSRLLKYRLEDLFWEGLYAKQYMRRYLRGSIIHYTFQNLFATGKQVDYDLIPAKYTKWKKRVKVWTLFELLVYKWSIFPNKYNRQRPLTRKEKALQERWKKTSAYLQWQVKSSIARQKRWDRLSRNPWTIW